MTTQELIAFFGTKYRVRKNTKVMNSTINCWIAQGYIPLDQQVKIEKLTHGALKARFEDGKKYD